MCQSSHKRLCKCTYVTIRVGAQKLKACSHHNAITGEHYFGSASGKTLPLTFRPWVNRDKRALCWWSFWIRREAAKFLLAERNASVQLQLRKAKSGARSMATANRTARIAARCRSQGRERRSRPAGGAARHRGADVDTEVAGGAAGRLGARGAAMARGGGKSGSLKDKLDGNELDLSLCGLTEVPVRELVSARACGAGREQCGQRADTGCGAAAW